MVWSSRWFGVVGSLDFREGGLDFREDSLQTIILGEVRRCIYSILSPTGVWVRGLCLSMLKHSPVWLAR
jgi:hypothetical protein